jgi:hypothetical protein
VEALPVVGGFFVMEQLNGQQTRQKNEQDASAQQNTFKRSHQFPTFSSPKAHLMAFHAFGHSSKRDWHQSKRWRGAEEQETYMTV